MNENSKQFKTQVINLRFPTKVSIKPERETPEEKVSTKRGN